MSKYSTTRTSGFGDASNWELRQLNCAKKSLKRTRCLWRAMERSLRLTSTTCRATTWILPISLPSRKKKKLTWREMLLTTRSRPYSSTKSTKSPSNSPVTVGHRHRTPSDQTSKWINPSSLMSHLTKFSKPIWKWAHLTNLTLSYCLRLVMIRSTKAISRTFLPRKQGWMSVETLQPLSQNSK